MADSKVDVTAGSGIEIDTRTEATNGHHRQVIVLGDPASNAGVAPVDATAGLKVDLGADNDITNAGTFAVQVDNNPVLGAGTNAIGKLAANDGIDIGDVTINNASLTVDLGVNNDVVAAGDVANDAADSGNPVKIGGKAESTTPAVVADGDRVDAVFDVSGNQGVFFGASLTYTSIDKTTTAAQDIVAAPGASNHLRIYGYTISNSGTEQVDTTITSVATFNTKDGSSITMVLPGYIDLASNTACQATLSSTSTNGILIGVYHRTIAD